MTGVRVEGHRLSVQQRRVWRVLESGRPCSAQALVAIEGLLDASRLAAALRAVVREHEILRTTYHRVPGVRTAVQVVRDDMGLEWSEVDGAVERIAADERARPFDLEHGPVVRATLFVRTRRLLITLCPMAADRATLRLVVGWTADHYAGRTPGEALRYVQYAERQHELADTHGTAALVTARADAALVWFPLPGGVAGAFESVRSAVGDYARSCGVRVESVLLAVWHVLLHRISGQREVSVGTAFPARKHEELRDCPGPFTLWVGTRSSIGDATGFGAVVAAIDSQLTATEEVEEFIRDADPTGWTAAFEYVPAVPTRGFPVVWDDVDAEPCDVRLTCIGDRLVWHSDRFGSEYLRHLDSQYRTLLAGLLADGSTPVRRVGALDPRTRGELLDGFVQGDVRPVDRTLHELFEEQAARTPDALAVADPGGRLSYRDLDALAGRIALWLTDKGIGPGKRVAVSLGHGSGLLAVLLGVLKAGGAYVPVDPVLPALRRDRLIALGGCDIVLDEDFSFSDVPAGSADARVSVRTDDVAYVLFTTGSTGEPKGVVVPHRAVVNYLLWCAENYASNGEGSVLHSSIGFDLTVTGLFLPLVTGRAVHADPAWRGHTRVIDEYGPTEAAAGCCAHEVTASDRDTGPVPIGRPIANTDIHLLGDDLEPVPIGFPGQVHVGGAGLAYGYLGASARTAESFIPHPFSAVPGARLYRTGDLACRTADGRLRYLGRIDEQVNVRGVRVEPEE
ncbi:non-ribosomal peptide synthetase component F [Saccharothrix tamanrassetensis]|uniref:Non-ribosomal peptide synthetase component F n=1 Tax=Saccharothrix tamanrassetensis TaxID=1051531 RepID=A0A841C9R5_9PSEU|nr:AMP-binding protein [Saccharothrix tamanrassetensis]MBB5953901.1 non-ribosomal peptide synthetase component F [Saccharothrix tamanrassetensis]